MTVDWAAVVQGLQAFTAVTWTYAALDRLGSVGRLLFGRPERWDAPWAAFCLLALTQLGFSIRWLVFPDSIPAMGVAELKYWSGLYLSSALTCVGLVWTQGLTAGAQRNRRALAAHLGVMSAFVAAAVAL